MQLGLDIERFATTLELIGSDATHGGWFEQTWVWLPHYLRGQGLKSSYFFEVRQWRYSQRFCSLRALFWQEVIGPQARKITQFKHAMQSGLDIQRFATTL